MAFHNKSLPDDFQYGSVFGGGFNTLIQTTSTGHEYRLSRQSQHRHRYGLTKLIQSQEEAMALKVFAISVRGAEHSWRLKDCFDFTSNKLDGTLAPTNLDMVLGVGDGVETRFQLVKRYDELGLAPYVRKITLPVTGSVVLAINGTPTTSFTMTDPGGLVTLSAPLGVGAVLSGGFRFEVPVRFSEAFDKWVKMRADAFDVWTPEQIDCEEVLDETEQPELWNAGGFTDHGTLTQSLTISYGEGELHKLRASLDISLFLPAPVQNDCGGPRKFIIIVHASSSNTVQIRDDAGAAIGSPLAAGATARVGLIISGSTFTWELY